MKLMATALVLGSMTATVAGAQDIIEIRHKSLKERASYPLIYWCLERSEVLAEYLNPGEFVVSEKAQAVAESGLLLLTFGDGSVFLTTDVCLDQTISAFVSFGGSEADLTITRK